MIVPGRESGTEAGGASRAVRHVCPNGLVLLLLPKRDLPVVAAEVFVEAGQSREPADKAGVAALTGRMLTEGTRRKSGLQIARQIEQVGGELSTHSVGGSLEVKSEDLPLGLELLADCLFAPSFPAREFDKTRDKQLTTLLAEQDDPQHVVRQAFDMAVYRKHPFARPIRGYRETVERLTRADCRAHHEAFYSPDRMILSLAGDFEPGAMIEQLAGSWGKQPVRPAPRVAIPRVRRQGAPRQVRVPQQKRQCHILIGHLGVRRTHPDFYRLQVMDNILGMGAGFTDRLSRILRDELGLAYTVYASITASAQLEPGTFHAYIGTSPDNEADAIAGMRAQMTRMQEELAAPEELAGAKAYLTGSFVFKFETVRQLCHYLVRAERFGLDGYRAGYRDWIDQVTAEDVRRVAREHLDPDNLTVAVAGPRR